MERTYATWRQDDAFLNACEAWPATFFPDAEYHYFADCGCLVCALAVMLLHCSTETELDEERFNPWILNQRLIDCGAFSSAADLDLEAIGRLYPLEYLGAVPFSKPTLAQLADQGQPCLITVPGKLAEQHFTTFLHMQDDDAVVYDPLCGEQLLSAYKQVCEIRMFRHAE